MSPGQAQHKLVQSASNGDLPGIDEALAAGADINAAELDGSGYTALQTAATRGEAEAFAHLLRHGADPNAIGSDAQTAPAAWLGMNQARSGNRILELAMQAGADLHWRNVNGKSYLHRAVISGLGPSVERLLDAGLEPDAKDQRLNTPLHMAVSQCFPSMCRSLVFAGADIDARNAKGERPIDLVDSAMNIEALNMLWALGADAQDYRYGDPRIREVLEASRLKAAVLTQSPRVIAWCLDRDPGITPGQVDEALALAPQHQPEAEPLLRSWKARQEARAALRESSGAGIQP